MTIGKIADYFTVVSISITFIYGAPTLLALTKSERSNTSEKSKVSSPKISERSLRQNPQLKSQRTIANQKIETTSPPTSRSEHDQAIIDRVRMGLKNGEYTK